VMPWSQDWLTAVWAYPGSCSMKWLGIFILPPGQDASPSQVNPQQIVRFPQQFTGTHSCSWVERRYCDRKASCPRAQHNVPSQGSNSQGKARTKRKEHL